MQNESRIFEDFAKLMNGVAGTVAGVGREAESSLRERMREFVGGMDFVSREEFDAVKQMAAAARAQVDALTQRLDALENGSASVDSASVPLAERAVKAAPAKDGASRSDVAGKPEKGSSKATKSVPAKDGASRSDVS